MMLEMLKVLLAPLAYLRIRHKVKAWCDWIYPAALSAISTVLVFSFGSDGTISGEKGLLEKILLVASVLPGFYIAALAAIATFNGREVDSPMPDPAPTLDVLINGKRNDIALTRRRFLAHLFSFLCFESLLLMAGCVFSALLGPNIVSLLHDHVAHSATVLVTFLILFAFWQMVCVTCLGLYYLGDRLHRPTY